MTVAREIFQLVGPREKSGGPSDLVQLCAQHCSSLCATARILRPLLHAGRLTSPWQIELRDEDLSIRDCNLRLDFRGGECAPRAHAMRVEPESLNRKPVRTSAVD
jgi:hypothetical protein